MNCTSDNSNMSIIIPCLLSDNFSVWTDKSSESSDNVIVFSNMSDILNCMTVFVALFSVVAGSLVANIVRTLDSNRLRSGFTLLAVLISDIVLAFSNLVKSFSILNFINRKRFSFLECPLHYANWVMTILFGTSLAICLLCLAVDQVIAVFRPIYFRTADGTRRKIIYTLVICFPVTLIVVILIYWSKKVVEESNDTRLCENLMTALEEVRVGVLPFVLLVSFITPCIYAVVFLKIFRQQHFQCLSRLESFRNRKLIKTFFFLTATYLIFWYPALLYFGVCFFNGYSCWNLEEINRSLIMHIMFSLNYLVDPVVCALRMKPIKQRIRLMWASS